MNKKAFSNGNNSGAFRTPSSIIIQSTVIILIILLFNYLHVILHLCDTISQNFQ